MLGYDKPCSCSLMLMLMPLANATVYFCCHPPVGAATPVYPQHTFQTKNKKQTKQTRVGTHELPTRVCKVKTNKTKTKQLFEIKTFQQKVFGGKKTFYYFGMGEKVVNKKQIVITKHTL